MSPMAYDPVPPYTAPITIGGRNPPSPPAAPTTPVTLPTCGGGTATPTSAKTAPLPTPSAAAMVRKNTAATPRGGSKLAAIAPTATTASAVMSTGTAVNRSASHPPTGRATVASSTNPAARLAAPVVDSP